MAVLAHPDDESLGFGGTLAKYAAEGVEVFLVTATRGEGGRYRGHRVGDGGHPGPAALAAIREAELRTAAVGARRARRVAARLSRRAARPRGAAGGGRRIADTSRACGRTSSSRSDPTARTAIPITSRSRSSRPPRSSMAATIRRVEALLPRVAAAAWAAYQAAFRTLRSTVDGVERQATPWPDWAITTVIDTRRFWPTVWRAVSCHESQVAAYERLKDLAPEHHEALWGRSRSIARSAR